jgi:integrase
MPRTDLERLLSVVTDPRDRAIFYLLLTTGMRRGELVGLKGTCRKRPGTRG